MKNKPTLNLVAGLMFILAACAQPTPTATPKIAATLTSAPYASLVILLAGSGDDPVSVQAASEIAQAYAAENNMDFQQLDSLDPNNVPGNLTILIQFPSSGFDYSALIGNVKVIAVGNNQQSNLPNVVPLPLGIDSEKVAFIAGYIAAISAEHWRTGILYTEADSANVNDFLAGAEYFCGSCVPTSPPLSEYPLAVQANDAQNWQSAADQLLAAFVRVVYLTPELESSGAAQYLASSGVLLIGQGTPPAELTGSWLISISTDPTSVLRELLPLALAGQPVIPVSTLAFANVNADRLSESRLTNIQQVIGDLMVGYIQLPAD